MTIDPAGTDDGLAAILDALVAQVPFEGWTERALRTALASIGQPPDEAALLFPGGAGEMIEAFSALSDARMAAAAQAADLAAYRVPARVRSIIALRLEHGRDHKEAIRRALAWLSLPTNAARAGRITAATVDAIWHAAGDTSSDFSWYTKRGTLAAVYSATLLYWLRDNSFDDEETLLFLDRRLENVAQIGQMRKQVEAQFENLRGFWPR